MKKLIFPGLAVLLLLEFSCVPKPKKPEGEMVEFQAYTTRFISYQTSAQVEGAVDEVERYLLDPRSIIATTAAAKVTPLSSQKFEKLGDQAEYRIELLGTQQTVIATLIYHRAGEEIWYFIKQKDQVAGMSIFRLKLKEFQGETKVSLSWALQISGVVNLFPQLAEMVDLPEIMADVIEMGVALGQVNFNPALKVEEILAGGRRGEFKDIFFQGTTYRVWINAPMEKVAEYLHNPETWETWKEKYYDFGRCLGQKWTEPCPLNFDLLGIVKMDASSFTITYRYPDISSVCWVFNDLNFISLVQIILKPDQGGTEMVLTMTVEPPPITNSPETMNFLMNAGKIGDTIKQMLLEIKTSVEGTG